MKEHNILQGIDLDIKQGETIGIIGLNGSGKSTLGKAIMNILPFREGDISLAKIDVTNKTTQELSERGIAFFMQGGKVFDELSIWENLVLSAKDEDHLIKIKEYFVLLSKSIKQLKKMRADKLSGGERHQLALAMCLLKTPKLLILDEPSAGLSPKIIDETYSVLKKIQKDNLLSILLIEQNISKAVEFCDSVSLLKEGRIEYSFENKDLKEIEKIMFKKSYYETEKYF